MNGWSPAVGSVSVWLQEAARCSTDTDVAGNPIYILYMFFYMYYIYIYIYLKREPVCFTQSDRVSRTKTVY